jgi:hypothetical protein
MRYSVMPIANGYNLSKATIFVSFAGDKTTNSLPVGALVKGRNSIHVGKTIVGIVMRGWYSNV